MTDPFKKPVKILVADDEETILELYKQILGSQFDSGSRRSEIEKLEAELFSHGGSRKSPVSARPKFELTLCRNGNEAVEAVHETVANGESFAMAFLDVRMPPGPDGIQTAENIRALSPYTQIVIVTAYSDIDPDEIERRVPPPDRLLYVQKPFHPFEIRQFASTLAARWHAEKLTKAINQELELIVEKRTAALKESNLKLEYQATHDTLTELLNRRAVFDVLKREISRGRRSEESISVMLADLDHFKNVNDTYGHQAGDTVLMRVSKILLECIRPYDSVGRIGGEEFLIVLPGCTTTDGLVVAERIRNAVGAEKMQIDDHSIAVSISIGIATSTTNRLIEHDALIRAADKALYKAKNEGRNTVQVIEEIEENTEKV